MKEGQIYNEFAEQIVAVVPLATSIAKLQKFLSDWNQGLNVTTSKKDYKITIFQSFH